MAIDRAVRGYETWLRKHTEVIEGDLAYKRKKLAKSAFVFLRGSYFRWAEIVDALCPDLGTGPGVLAVGDVHVENYGVWRDEEGRLAWGVNDFDESAWMPYAFDLVRLATSAMLARDGDGPARAGVCEAILAGYVKRLAKPVPYVLDEKNVWMRKPSMATAARRQEFWREVDELDFDHEVPAAYRTRLKAALPPGAETLRFAPRQAGVGSLGRPRYVVVARWRGGRIVREAKALVPSAWTRYHPTAAPRQGGDGLAEIVHRPADPSFQLFDDMVIRRLAPDSRKLDLGDHSPEGLQLRLLRAMGAELGNIHAATKGAGKRIDADLSRKRPNWLEAASALCVEATQADFKAWRAAYKRRHRKSSSK